VSIQSHPIEEQTQNIPSKTLPERHWMVKVGALMLAGSGINSALGLCSNIVDAQSQSYNPLVVIIVSIGFLLWGAAQLATAWGIWHMKELARKAFIFIVAINVLLFLCGLSSMADQGVFVVAMAAIFGLIVRGYFIYWFSDNKQYFTEQSSVY
jgi:hypothetical protein